MTHDDAIRSARDVATAIAPHASSNDEKATFSEQAIDALGKGGLLGLVVRPASGGAGLDPRTFGEVVRTLAEADGSVAMVYVMHVCGTLCIQGAAESSKLAARTLEEIGKGTHLTTLAFSEKGSRSHFWAPVSRAERAGAGAVRLTAYKSWVTSAGHAASYVLSTQRPDAKSATDTVLYLATKGTEGMRVAGPWTGLGLRANASSPMTFEGSTLPADAALTAEGDGFKTMLEVVLPWFILGSASMSLGLCRGALAATAKHLGATQLEHMGQTLGAAFPNLRAALAQMQIDTEGLAARIDRLVGALEKPDDSTMLRVLETKAAAAETAIVVTQRAMRTCGGAAFSKHTSIERFFRDAQASAVMAPTTDVLYEFIGRALLGMPLFDAGAQS